MSGCTMACSWLADNGFLLSELMLPYSHSSFLFPLLSSTFISGINFLSFGFLVVDAEIDGVRKEKERLTAATAMKISFEQRPEKRRAVNPWLSCQSFFSSIGG